MPLSYYTEYAQLTPVRVASSGNIAGTYSNGPSNNGVGATLTIAASSLTIDSVVMVEGDRVLLNGQTSTFQNGIYVVSDIGATVILTRAPDFHSIEQLQLGQFVCIFAGTVFGGRPFTLIEPLPGAIGVDAISFSSPIVNFTGSSTDGNFAMFADASGTLIDDGLNPSDATKDVVVMADAAVIIGHIGVYTDTRGTLSDDAATAINGGNIQAGLSGTAGFLASFPATAARGSLRLTAINNAGDSLVTISNASHGQASVYSIPDGGQATAEFIISDSAGTQHITSGSLQVDAGNLLAGSSGAAGIVSSFPAAATTGSLRLVGVANSGDFTVDISNRSHGQSTVYSIGDVGAATGSILVSAVNADPNANLIWFDVTCGQAALAAGGLVALITSSGAKQYKVREIIMNDGGTDFSGGGGDRLGQVGDGTSIYSIIPAASLQTLVNARWGSTAVAFPTAIAANTNTAAGANLSFSYNAGTTDYTAGSVVISGMVQRVA